MNVSSVSDYALKLLGERAQGSVHSVFATSFNVELAGELIHIGSEVRCSLSCLGVTSRRGRPCLLWARSRRAIRLSGTAGASWSSGRARHLACVRSACAGRVHRVPHALAGGGHGPRRRSSTARSTACDLVDCIGLPWDGEERSVTALTSFARFSSMCLAHALGARFPVRVEDPPSRAMSAAVDYLVGRGLGLTPSGDDVLCGLVAGLRSSTGWTRLAASLLR